MQDSTIEKASTGSRRITAERILLVLVLLIQAAISVQLVRISRRQDVIDSQLTSRVLAMQSARETSARGTGVGEAQHPQPDALWAINAFPTMRRSRLSRAARAFDDMDALFAQVFTDFERLEETFNLDDQWRSLMVSPTLDMRESAQEYNVYFSLPGLDPRDVEVALDGRIVTIQASCAHPIYGREYGSPATLQKRVQLPGPVGEASQASAVWTNDALRISIPKAQDTIVVPASMRLF